MEETTYPEFEILTKTLSKEGKFTIKRTQGSIEAVNTSKMIPKGTTINDKYDYALFGCMAIYHDIENVESLDLKGNGKLKKFLKAFKRGGVTERLKKLCLDTIIELEKAGNDAQKKQKILNSFMLKLHSIVDELSTQSKKATNAKAATAEELASLHVSLLCKGWETLQEFYKALVKLNKNEPLSPLDKAAKKFKNFINGNKDSDSDNGEESDENEEPEDGEDESDENEESDDEADSDDNKKSKKPKKPNSKKRKGFRIKGSKKSNKKKQNENSDDGELEEKYYSSDDEEEHDSKDETSGVLPKKLEDKLNLGNPFNTPSEEGTSGDDFDNSEGNDEDPSEGSDADSYHSHVAPNMIQTSASQYANYVQRQDTMNYSITPPNISEQDYLPYNGYPQQGDDFYRGYNSSGIQPSMGQPPMTSKPPPQQSNLQYSSKHLGQHQTSDWPAPATNSLPSGYPADVFPQSQEYARQFYPQNTLQSSVPVVPPTSAPQPTEYNLSTPNYSGQSYSKVEGSKYATMNQNGNRIAAANMRVRNPQAEYPPPPPRSIKQYTKPNLNDSQPVSQNLNNTAFASSMPATRQQNYPRQESRNNVSQNSRATYTHGYRNPAPTATQFGAPQKTIYAPIRNANSTQPTSSTPQPGVNVATGKYIYDYNIQPQTDRQFNAPRKTINAPNNNAHGSRTPSYIQQPGVHANQGPNIHDYNIPPQTAGQFGDPQETKYALNNNANGTSSPNSRIFPPRQRRVTFAHGQTSGNNLQSMEQPRNNRIPNSPPLANMASEPVQSQSPKNVDRAPIQNNNFSHTAQTQNVKQHAPNNQALNSGWPTKSNSNSSGRNFVMDQVFTAESGTNNKTVSEDLRKDQFRK